MERQEIIRSALRTGPVAAAAALMAAPVFGPLPALCYGLTAVWGVLNLLALSLLLEMMISRRAFLPGLFALQIKLLVLFGGAALLFQAPFFSLWPFLIGFHTVFAVIGVEYLRGEVLAPAAARRALP